MKEWKKWGDSARNTLVSWRGYEYQQSSPAINQSSSSQNNEKLSPFQTYHDYKVGDELASHSSGNISNSNKSIDLTQTDSNQSSSISSLKDLDDKRFNIESVL